MLSQYDRLIRTASRGHVPFGVLFEVTHRCNLGCEHCYLTEGPVGRPKPTREELPLEEIRPILDQLAAAGCLFLTLSGGEVFMRRDFLQIVAHARSRGFSVTVFTTGTLLTPETATELANLHPLSVEVSIYSARSEIHDRVTRIPGSHARSLRALRMLKERGVIILIKSPLMNLNSGEYHGIVELAGDLGAGYGFDPMLVPRRDGNTAPVGLGLDRQQLYDFFSDPVLAKEHFQPVKCLPQPGEEICGTGRRTCLISPYGDVFPCGVHPIPAGNLREKSFYEIWTGSPLLKDLRTKTVDDLRGGAKAIPGFRCSALALIENGDFLGPFRRGEELAEIQAEVRGRQGSAPA
ncbi:MAG: radical SAM protein [Candidatus Rokubacteria bacterium]|nr:radical SAM protein [Candidatus Rokubacteria bacterium]